MVKFSNCIWLVYQQKYKTSHKYLIDFIVETGNDVKINYEIKYVDEFKIEHGLLYYDNVVISVLPKIVFMRCASQDLDNWFESHGVTLVNNTRANRFCLDKFACIEYLKSYKYAVPLSYIAKRTDFEKLSNQLGIPFVLKDNFGKRGENAYLIQDKLQYQKVFDLNKVWLAQKFIANSKGKDIRVYVVGKKIAGIMKRENKNDWRSNLNQGGNAEKYRLNIINRHKALKIAKLINLEIGAVDFLIGKRGLIFCEANSYAGFEGFLTLNNNIPRKIFKYFKKKFKLT